MHPEIMKFWEQIGEVDLTPSVPIIYWVVQLYGDGKYLMIAKTWNGGIEDGPEQPSEYFWENVTYSEEEMLSLIKQKAFL